MGVFKEDAPPSVESRLNDGLRTWVTTRLFFCGAGLSKALGTPPDGLAKKPYETGVAVPNSILRNRDQGGVSTNLKSHSQDPAGTWGCCPPVAEPAGLYHFPVPSLG